MLIQSGSASSNKSSPYGSAAFKNTDPKIREDVTIYQMLRDMCYSDKESKDAVIESVNK